MNILKFTFFTVHKCDCSTSFGKKLTYCHFKLFVFICSHSQEHFYDPSSHCGFLEMRLRNIRRKLEAGQRRYTKRKKSCVSATEQEDKDDNCDVSEWVTLMKRLRPSSENITSIKSAMEKTFTRRRSWISQVGIKQFITIAISLNRN